MTTCRSNRPETVKVLVDTYGCDPDGLNLPSGPLHVAVQDPRRVDCVAALLARCEHPTRFDARGVRPPAHLSADEHAAWLRVWDQLGSMHSLHSFPIWEREVHDALLELAVQSGGGSSTQMDYQMVPTTVYTPLEYGCVGYSEEDAIAAFGEANIEVYHQYFQPLEWRITFPNHMDANCYAKLIVHTADGARGGTARVRAACGRNDAGLRGGDRRGEARAQRGVGPEIGRAHV